MQAKSKRISQACDFCHRRGLKCKLLTSESGGGSSETCLTCVEYDQHCTRLRQPKRRGTKPQTRATRDGLSDLARLGQVKPPSDESIPRPAFMLGSRKTITALLDVYLDTIHPMFPIFCERELWVGWRDGSFPTTPSDYMSLMCMCALSAQHVGNGALFSEDVPNPDIKSLAHEYLTEAIRLVPLEFAEPCVNQIRSYAFLTLLGSQKGNNALAHKYLGLYHGLCAHYNLHDESQWPSGAGDCEIEARRRLWWIMYRLEVHTACVHGSLIRLPEGQCYVGYPCGTHHEAFIPGRDGQFEDWFAGWNVTTDLYRVLEHVIADFRTRRRPQTSILGGEGGAYAMSLANRLSMIQQEIPPYFGSASSRSSDSGRNRCGFQAYNILCTIHLARMISISGDSNFQSACQTACDMITSMETIPIEYIRAVGSPLLQQLAGVGHMLAGLASKHQLTKEEQEQCEQVMVAMISLLARQKEYNSTAATEEKRLASRLADVGQRSTTASDTGSFGSHFGHLSFSPTTGNLDDIYAEMLDGQSFFSTHLGMSLTWAPDRADVDAIPQSVIF